MDEHFQGKRGTWCVVRDSVTTLRRFSGQRSSDLFNVLERTFAGEHNQTATQFACELDAADAADRHLRAGMEREIARQLANHSTDPDVLQDGAVDARPPH